MQNKLSSYLLVLDLIKLNRMDNLTKNKITLQLLSLCNLTKQQSSIHHVI